MNASENELDFGAPSYFCLGSMLTFRIVLCARMLIRAFSPLTMLSNVICLVAAAQFMMAAVIQMVRVDARL